MNCKLVKLSKEYKEQFLDMIKEWKEYNDTHDCNKSPGAIFRLDYNDFDNYVDKLEYVDPNSGFVPGDVYFCLDLDRNVFVGAVHIRHYLNQGLYETGGHIGDGIRPSERRKGYATEMIRLALEKCKELGIRRVLITCYPDNIGSAKSIINNGGVYCDEALEDGLPCSRYWVDVNPFRLEGKKVSLRDLRDEDIKDRYKWECEDTEWKEWDEPWADHTKTPEEMKQHLEKFLEDFKETSKKIANLKDELRMLLEIYTEDNKHIGWVIAYHINDNYEYTPESDKIAVGIIIPPISERNKGYGSDALLTYFAYLKEMNVSNIFLQTWSGNEPMKNVAKKIGLKLIDTKENYRNFNGKSFNGLTYKL